MLEDVHLLQDVGISNGIHRKMLLQAIQEKESNLLAEERGDSEAGQRVVKNIDVFISYRFGFVCLFACLFVNLLVQIDLSLVNASFVRNI